MESYFENPDVEKLLARIAELEDQNRQLKTTRKHVGLVWKTVPEGGDAQRILERHFPLLQKDEKLSCYKAAAASLADKTAHLLIEGDNLSALFALNYTHHGKVDVIYIDPPYNTGNEDFVYNDRRDYRATQQDLNDAAKTLSGQEQVSGARSVGKADGYRHSKWLSFMAPRLFLARDLLSKTGVIIVAIDDNEHARVKLLLDEIMGEDNFLADITWQGDIKNDARFVSNTSDYMLIYAKSKQALIEGEIKFRVPKTGVEDMILAAQDFWNEARLGTSDTIDAADIATKKFRAWMKALPNDHPVKTQKGNALYNNIDSEGRVYRGDNLSWPGGGGPTYEILHPRTNLPVKMPSRGWLAIRATMDTWLGEGRILFGKDETTIPQYKRLLTDVMEIVPKDSFAASRADANKEMARILGQGVFDFPKNTQVVKTWINTVVPKNKRQSAIVLDFFAGSGTTGHAVAELNMEDGGSRQAILVTHNDENGKNIASDITAVRMQKVLSGQDWADGKAHDPLPGELHYYRLSLTQASVLKNEYAALEEASANYAGLAALMTGAHNVITHESWGSVLKNEAGEHVVVLTDAAEYLLNPDLFEETMKQLRQDHELIEQATVFLPVRRDELDYQVDGFTLVPYPEDYLDVFNRLVGRLLANTLLSQEVDESEATDDDENI